MALRDVFRSFKDALSKGFQDASAKGVPHPVVLMPVSGLAAIQPTTVSQKFFAQTMAEKDDYLENGIYGDVVNVPSAATLKEEAVAQRRVDYTAFQQ